MRDRPPRPSRLLPLLTVALMASACLPAPPDDAPAPWQRLDLATTAPSAVEENLHGASTPWTTEIGHLGSEEVRNLRRLSERQLRNDPFRRAPQIRVLRQAAGTRLAWPVELGRAPYVSFIPVGWRGARCPCLYRLGLRDARGGLHELYRTEVNEVEPLAPGPVEIDLTDFAHSRVELLFQVDVRLGETPPAEAEPPRALWGSPALYHRAPSPDGSEGSAARPARSPDAPPNVVFLGLDTLRADHVGPWRPQPTFTPSLTPAIDRLAGESDVWLRAYATFNSTNPSFASIFTGLYGKNHGVYNLKTPLPEEHRTLAELFSEAGYDTTATISASHLGDHNSGLGQGFDRVLLSEHTFAAELPVDHFMDWISDREGGREGRAPFFAWIHLFDPHTPHTPPEPYSTGLRPWRATGLSPVTAWVPFRRPEDRTFSEPVLGGHRDLYAGEVAYLDHQVDRLLGFLESRDLLESTLLVLVSDHGENLGEHGIDFRHLGLWETTTHVPLLIRWPGGEGRGRRFEGMVQTIDLFPTVLAAAGLEAPPSDGVDLRRLTDDGRQGRRAVFAEHAGDGGPAGAMVRTSTHRYMRVAGVSPRADGEYLYALANDPEEENNLVGQGLAVEQDLTGLLERWLKERRERPATETRELNEDERNKLRALGYIE